MTRRNSFPIYWCALLIVLSSTALWVSAGEPRPTWLEDLRRRDASTLPAYTLRVTLEEPANFIFRDQGNSVKTCTITEGPVGLAAWCQADKLPKPVYHPPGTFNTQGMDYDDHGRLGVGMRARWITLRTAKTNETYEENRVFYVSPQGVVVDAGVSRRLDRCPPDDKGRCSWTFTTLRRIWWALGHGFASDLIKVEGDVSDSGNVNRARIRGSLFGFPGGRWEMDVEKPPTKLVRQATFIRDVDGQPLHQVTTHGARHFGDVVLADGGSFRSLLGDGYEGIERRVVLKEFEPRFDEELFRQVKETLERVRADDTVKVVDYPRGPPTPPPVATHPPAPDSDQ